MTKQDKTNEGHLKIIISDEGNENFIFTSPCNDARPLSEQVAEGHAELNKFITAKIGVETDKEEVSFSRSWWAVANLSDQFDI